MLTVAGGILLAALILGIIGAIFVCIAHWFGTSDARASQKKWELEMEAKRNSTST
jgi:uncharacterized transporter YbjL